MRGKADLEAPLQQWFLLHFEEVDPASSIYDPKRIRSISEQSIDGVSEF